MEDKVQKILSEIATRKLCTMDEHMAFYNDKAKEDYRFLSEIEELIKALQKEPVSEELEEAIDTYLKSYWGGEKEKQEWPFLKKMVIYFAKWQKEQMMAKAIDAHCFGFQDAAALFTFRLPADNYLIGSKVKVIVIKED